MQKRKALLDELKPLMEKKADELTAEERTQWDARYPELANLDNDYRIALEQEEALRAEASRNGEGLSSKDKEDIKRYSFRRAIMLRAQEKALDGIEAEMHAEAEKEAASEGRRVTGIGVPLMLLANRPVMGRASTGQSVGTAADGGYLKQDQPLMYIEALKNRLLLPGMGARYLTGLVGDLPLVIGGTFSASWLAEDGTDTTGKLTLTKKTMSPKRLQATGAMSIQLLRQSTPDVESLIEYELQSAQAQALQTAAINGTGADNQPTGILNTSGIGAVAGGTNGLAPTYGNIIGLETEVAIDNADQGSLYYLTNAKIRGKLKQTEKASGTAQFVWVGSEMNGYPAMVTNAVPSNLTKGTSSEVCSAIIYGDFSKLYIGQWGGMDMIVDPYSLKKKGEVEVTVISYHDIALVHAQAFAAMKDALTT